VGSGSGERSPTPPQGLNVQAVNETTPKAGARRQTQQSTCRVYRKTGMVGIGDTPFIPEAPAMAAAQHSPDAGAPAINNAGIGNTLPTPAKWPQWIYLGLAISGAAWTWLANLAFIRENAQSFDVGLFLQLANANDPARSLFRDLTVLVFAVGLWMAIEARRLAMRHVIWPFLGCGMVAFAFGAPLFLFLRERRLLEIHRQTIREGGSPPSTTPFPHNELHPVQPF